MTIDMSQFYQVFFEESAEHLAEMERMLLEVDIDAPNVEDLNAIFRAAHSIKGGSGTFGFTDMTEVTHILENLLDKLRKGEMAPRSDMIDAFLEAADVLKDQLSCHVNGTLADVAPAETVTAKLKALAEGGGAAVAQPATESAVETSQPVISEFEEKKEEAASGNVFIITFTAPEKFLKKTEALEGLQAELKNLGELEVLEMPTPGSKEKKKSKKDKEKKSANVVWKFRLKTNSAENTIREMLSFVANDDQIEIETVETQQVSAVEAEDEGFGFFSDIPSPTTTTEDDGYGFFGDIPTPAPAPEEDNGYGFFEEIKPPVAPAVQPKAASPAANKPVAAPAQRATDKAAAGSETTSIRVGVEKVDQLINLVGELVITQAMLSQTASEADQVLYEALHNSLAQLERNTRDLQESVMSIRMMPISFVFSRFPRVVRDLASKLNKQVELVTIGENTELDKGLIEKIADPLTHLVRNSLDHGIELPEKRLAAGKPAKGTITLSASHQGGSIVIEVADDGAGLNRDKILAKATERGLPVSESMTDNEVWMLIFEAGFSTADVVTDVSGRGVGMDVVRRNISEMGGNVDIESVTGVGSKMIVRLPLTLAILDGMTVALGDSIYVIPLNLIVETLQPKAEDIRSVTGEGQVVNVRGEYLPLIALHKIFSMEPQFHDPTKGVLVMIEDKGKKAALFVDSLVGQQQVVIKSLETNYRKVAGVSGATIMGDGRVALIIDVPALIKMGQTQG